MKCWNSAFNAQVIIVVVQVGAVEIYVAAVEALRKHESEGQNRMKLSLRQKKIGAFLTFTPRLPHQAHCPILDETQVSSAVFSWLYREL
jgi:hypothetical protein